MSWELEISDLPGCNLGWNLYYVDLYQILVMTCELVLQSSCKKRARNVGVLPCIFPRVTATTLFDG